jgi:hypothetical protein
MSNKEDYYSYANQFILEEEPWELVTNSRRKNSQHFSDSGSINSQAKSFVSSVKLPVQHTIPSAPKQIVQSNKTQIVQSNKSQIVQSNKTQIVQSNKTQVVLNQVIENKRISPNSKSPNSSKFSLDNQKLDDVLPTFQNENKRYNNGIKRNNNRINENWRRLDNHDIIKPIPQKNDTEQIKLKIEAEQLKQEQLRQEQLKQHNEAEQLKQEQLKQHHEAEQLRQEQLKQHYEAEQLRQEQLRQHYEAEQLRQEHLRQYNEAEEKKNQRNLELIRQKQIVDLIWENDAIQQQFKQEQLRQEKLKQEEELRQVQLKQEELRQEQLKQEHYAILKKYPLNIQQLNELTYSLQLPSIQSLIEFSNNDINNMVSIIEQKKIDSITSEKVNVIIHYLINIFQSGGLEKSILGKQLYQPPVSTYQHNTSYQHTTAYQSPSQSYQLPAQSYQSPAQSYQSPVPRFQSYTPKYQSHVPKYQSPTQKYKPPALRYKSIETKVLTLAEIESNIPNA